MMMNILKTMMMATITTKVIVMMMESWLSPWKWFKVIGVLLTSCLFSRLHRLDKYSPGICLYIDGAEVGAECCWVLDILVIKQSSPVLPSSPDRAWSQHWEHPTSHTTASLMKNVFFVYLLGIQSSPNRQFLYSSWATIIQLGVSVWKVVEDGIPGSCAHSLL